MGNSQWHRGAAVWRIHGANEFERLSRPEVKVRVMEYITEEHAPFSKASFVLAWGYDAPHGLGYEGAPRNRREVVENVSDV